jgi:Domain of unknown function (DUF4340)
MKKSTLILVALALLLGGAVYYFEFKHPPKSDDGEEVSRTAFPFRTDDVTGLTITRNGQRVVIEKQGEVWAIKQPVETGADASVIDGIATSLANAQITRTFPAAPDRLQAFGLNAPALTIEIRTKKGAEHRLRLGVKDFSGNSVYGLIGEGREVDLLPASVLTTGDKSFDDLRDRSVLDLTGWDISGFQLKNKAGEISAMKKGSNWQIEKPRATAADASEMDSLVAQVTSARMTGVVSETATDLAKYGLVSPEITFQARTIKGEERSLLIGHKTGDDYYARDTARHMIFRVNAELYRKLGDSFFDLRDKAIVHFERDTLAKVEIHNRNGRIVCVQGAENKWTVEQPAQPKGKEVQAWKFLDPIDNARAQEIYDSPAGGIAAKLARPAVDVTLTDKSGKTTKLSFSAESGGAVYARSSAGAQIYKLSKQILDDLNLKASDLVK